MSMLQASTPQSLADAVKRSLEEEIKLIMEEEAEKAAAEVERKVRRRVKELTIRASAAILQKFDMQIRSNELVIRVNFEEGER